MSYTMTQKGFLLAFLTGPKSLFSVQYSLLFAFDSDMIIASLPGFKVIACLSSEKIECFEEVHQHQSNRNVIMIYCSSEIGFTAWWIPFTLQMDMQSGFWNGMSLLLERSCMASTDVNKMHHCNVYVSRLMQLFFFFFCNISVVCSKQFYTYAN